MLHAAIDSLLLDYREFRWVMIADRLWEEREEEARKEKEERAKLLRWPVLLQTIPEIEESLVPAESDGLGRVFAEDRRILSARIKARR